MNTLYLIGGSPRCGKTIIFNEIIQKKPMIAIPTDAIRSGVRYLNKQKRIDFSEKIVEDELPWEMVVGIIERYDHKDIPLIIEGVVITPERVHGLQLKNLKLKVAFVGFTEDAYIDTIVEYGIKQKDYVFDSITENAGDDSAIRKTFKGIQENNKKLRSDAREYGYAFFTPDTRAFEDYTSEVVAHLLS